MTDDFYFFDEKNLRYIGQRTGKVFKMSDRVKVRVSSASKKDKSVDFEIVGMKSNKKTTKTVIINKRKDNDRKNNRKRNDRRKKRHEEPRFTNNHFKRSKKSKSKHRA